MSEPRAHGSTNSYGGWEPRHCYVCGERIVKSREHAGFAFNDQTWERRSWHFGCARGPRWERAA